MKDKKNIGIVYSSFNNYSMFENEVLKRVNFNNYPVINIDDHSFPEEQEKGRNICLRNNIIFQINKKKGVQHALNQGIEYLKSNFNCEWVFCLQQDIFPSNTNFFINFEKYISDFDTSEIGALGFNCIEKGQNHYTNNSYEIFQKNGHADGFLGVFFLSDTKNHFKKMSFIWFLITKLLLMFGSQKYKSKAKNYIIGKRAFCENYFHNFKKFKKNYSGLFAIELPCWAGIAVNVNLWQRIIRPKDKFIFHLWFPDIAMQFLNANIYIAVTSDLYLTNDQKIKEKYGFHSNSAIAGMKNQTNHVEEYGPHLINFKHDWGFDYINSLTELPNVIFKYKNTLVEKFYNHNCRKGPIRIWNKN